MTTTNIELHLERTTPLDLTKQFLTGAPAERVMTGVLPSINSFAINPKIPIYEGPQIDVYIAGL